MGAAGEHLRDDGQGGAEVGASAGDGAGVVGHAGVDGTAEHILEGSRCGTPAAGAWWQAAAHFVRDPGDGAAPDIRAVYVRLPGGRVSTVPGAAAAGDVRIRGQPDPDQREGAREKGRALSVILCALNRAERG